MTHNCCELVFLYAYFNSLSLDKTINKYIMVNLISIPIIFEEIFSTIFSDN